MHRNFTTVNHRVTRFSQKCLEILTQEKESLNNAIK